MAAKLNFCNLSKRSLFANPVTYVAFIVGGDRIVYKVFQCYSSMGHMHHLHISEYVVNCFQIVIARMDLEWVICQKEAIKAYSISIVIYKRGGLLPVTPN